MVRFGDSFHKKLWTECGAVFAVMPGFFSWLLEDRGVSIGDLDALTWWFIPSIVGTHGLQTSIIQPRLKTQSLMTNVYTIQHLWILWREMWLHGLPGWGTCFVGTMCATFAVLQAPMLSNDLDSSHCEEAHFKWILKGTYGNIIPFVLHGPKGEESGNKCENLHFSRFVVLSFRSIWSKHQNGTGCAWGCLVFVVDTKGDRWGWVRRQPKWIAELDKPYLKFGCLTYM